MSLYSKFAPYYEKIFPFRENTNQFLTSYLPKEARAVIDLGCGTGHYAGWFAKAGFQSVGIDLDAAMIQSAQANYPQAEFHCLNLLELPKLKRRFDLAFCIGNVAAHLTQQKFMDFLKHLKECLHPGGVWIFQVVNWDFILEQKDFIFPEIKFESEQISFQRRYQNISEQEIQFGTTLRSPDSIIFTETTTLYPVRTEGYQQMHEQAGFEFIGQFGDFSGALFREEVFSGNVLVWKNK